MAIKTSKSAEAYFARYKQSGVYATNRKRKLERALKRQPNNAQIPLAIKGVASYRRKDPKEPYWSHQMIETAKVYKRFLGVFDKGIFSQKLEDQDAARYVRNNNLFKEVKKPVQNKKRISEFSLAARAHDSNGNLVWA
jgi:hypothetical protein